MKLTLKNDAGLVREVPTGRSYTGFLFTGFTMMIRGMVTKGLLFLLVALPVQMVCSYFISAGIDSVAQGTDALTDTAPLFFLGFIVTIPNLIFWEKLNKWTARHWLDRGYKPCGPGWEQWGPKYGLQVDRSDFGK